MPSYHWSSSPLYFDINGVNRLLFSVSGVLTVIISYFSSFQSFGKLM